MPADWIAEKKVEYYQQEKTVKKQRKNAEKGANRPGMEVIDFVCLRCGGEKHCEACSGTTEIARGGLLGIVSSTMTCPFCKGAGICQLCNGVGTYKGTRVKVA